MRILVGVDLGRPGYEHVVTQAGRFARSAGASVDLLYVGPPEALPRLETVLAELPAGVAGRAIVKAGSPVDVLVDEAATADVLVVGPRPPNPLERLLLGTVAARVVRRAPVAVWVPRAPWPEEPSRILCAVDLDSSAPERVVALAAEWADRLSVWLDLLYVDELRPPPVFDAALREAAEREIEAERAPARARLAALLATVPEGRRGEGLVVGGDPGSQIAEASGRYDLVVMGSIERQGLGQHLLGSVAEYVASHADACVLACPVNRG